MITAKFLRNSLLQGPRIEMCSPGHLGSSGEAFGEAHDLDVGPMLGNLCASHRQARTDPRSWAGGRVVAFDAAEAISSDITPIFAPISRQIKSGLMSKSIVRITCGS